jgi:hypothetical protein
MPISFKNTIADDIKKARAEGNEAKANALELLAGGISTGVGVVTGLPDIGIAGYNFLKDKTSPEVKDIRTRVLEAGGIPTSGGVAYNVPEVAAGVYGLASLAKSGWKFLKEKKNTKKIAEFLGELPADTQNVFKKYMMTGQGSDDPVIAATLQKLKTNPNYSELFTTLEKGATDAALKNMDVVSNTSKTKSAERIITAVNDKIENTTKDALEAGSKLYDKANKTGNGRRIVSTEKTLAEVRKLIAEYSKKASPSSENAVKFLRSVEERLVPSFTTEARAGTTVKGAAEPSRVIPGAPATTQTVQVPVSYIDDLGMTRTRMETKTITSPSRGSTTIAGTTEPTRVIPGAPSTTISQGAKNLTTEEVQSLLTEFGKKASGGDTLLKDVSLSDEKRISSAIFGNLKDDLRESARLATSAEDRGALNMLQAARTQTKDAYQNLSNLTAQGIPKFLQGKSMNEISFDDLQQAYVGLNPRQRAIFRKHVETSDPEALKTLDKSIYDGFVSKHKTELPDGTMGTDLGSLARAWAKEDNLSLNDRNMIAYSMGQNFTEFDKRMKDALVFTRKMSVGGVPAEEASTLSKVAGSIPAIVGSTPAGYSGAKATELSIDVVKAMMSKSKLTDDMLMKALMTPEGSSFLKSASMSPRSQKTLESITKLNSARPSNVGLGAMATSVSGALPATEQPVNEYIPPEDLFTAPQQQEYVPPEDLFNEQTPVTGPTNKAEAAMAADIGTPDQMAQQMQQYYKPLYDGLRGDISSGAYNPAMASPEEMNFLRRAGLVQ